MNCPMRMRIAIATIFSVSLLSVPPASARTAGNSQENIMTSAADRWGKAFNERDLNALLDLYTEDAELLPKGTQAITGHAAIRCFLTALLAATPETQRTIFTNVQTFGKGDTISEVADIEKEDAEGKRTVLGRQILILQRESGEWKVRIDMWTTNDK